MVDAQTKEHEEDKHTGMQEKIRKERQEKDKVMVGSKAQKHSNRTQGVSIATYLPVSTTKPRRGPCHTLSLIHI